MSRTRVNVHYLVPVRITLGYSEVVTHLGLAGTDCTIVLYLTKHDGAVVQLLDDEGQSFSFPILPGEAGLYRDANGTWYGYRNSTEDQTNG